MLKCVAIMGNGNDPPAYHPNILMKSMNSTNSGLMCSKIGGDYILVKH